MMTNRREFIKKSCTGCIALTGWSTIAAFLYSCSPLPIYKTDLVDNKFIIPISTFKEGEKMKILQAKKLSYDVLLVKESNVKYHALEMKCTHQDTNLIANSKGLSCNLHGSTFNLNGKVTNGPASRPLLRYAITLTETDIIVQL